MKRASESRRVERREHAPLGFALVLLLLVSAPMAAQEPGAADGPVTIRGQVTDAESGAPISGAYVEPMDRRAAVITDAEGRFTLRGLLPGDRLEVSLLGYETARADIPRSGGAMTIQLEPNPVMLEGIRILADRFEDRRRSVGHTVRIFDHVDLLETEYHNVLDLLERRTRLQPSRCPGMPSVTECTRQRGGFRPVVVYIDEIEADLQYLRGYSPRDMYLVEVYRGGSHIRAYTNLWVRDAGERGVDLQPFRLPRIRMEHRSSTFPPL